MYLNGNWIGKGHADEFSNTASRWETFSFQSTLNLQNGDEIWLQIDGMSIAGAYLYGDFFTQFSGYLLEEKIAVV